MLSNERRCLRVRALQARDPVAERVDVMFAQILHVARLEPDSLRALDERAKRHQLATRKDILLDERIAPPQPGDKPFQRALSRKRFAAHYAMIEKQAAWFERSEHAGIVFRKLPRANVLAHPDAHRLVEPPLWRQVSIVPYLDAHSITHSRRSEPLPR